MAQGYARIIIDISAENVDRPFTYAVPPELHDCIRPGSRVEVPFGSSDALKTGYVLELCDRPDFDASRIKSIRRVLPDAIDAREEVLRLAIYMADRYGSTLNAALKAALPVKRSIRKNSRRKDPVSVIDGLEGAELSSIPDMNREQREAFEGILSESGRPCLLYGITGSGKTLVYIRLIEEIIGRGGRAIVLIPEISLTYQTVRQLSLYFSGRISVLHSRLSEGERYEQYLRAEKGEVDVVVGPRSAVFTPLPGLGLIIIDEEHERAYHSDTSPRYDAREVAIYRAEQCGARVVLGSATPSLESYTAALQGRYALFRLRERAVPGAGLPRVSRVDMRKELEQGNRSIFSERLRALMEDRLGRGEQIILFLNRRGYGGFVSCRSCGYVVRCPHCDVSMTAHNEWYFDRQTGSRSARLVCHYCGYEQSLPRLCPQCGSRYIAVFGTGTQKLEQAVHKEFPKARVLRMDADTTKRKGSHERILSAFSAHKADVLVGTQMIVKGHDFPDVTLVGIVAADLSLNMPEFDAAERTFQLLTQASGRSGRAERPGDVVIQSYEPDHYAIAAAADADYESFYEREMSFRRMLSYPPVSRMLCLRMQSQDEELLDRTAEGLVERFGPGLSERGMTAIGPCDAVPFKVNDIYRKILYIKQVPHDIMSEERELFNFRELMGAYVSEISKGRVLVSYELF